MGSSLDLVFYNPDQLEDDDFLNGFVARRALAEKILARLGAIKPRGLAQHRLIVGQRGMGKTSLLRRIALGVRDQPSLSAVFLPLRFREEQYNVHHLHAFWTNCLDALGDWFEAEGRRDEAESIDREVAELDPKADDEHGTQALDLFVGWMKKEKRRPLLLLDNLDIIFNGLKNAQWSLRQVLQKEGGIVIVGASASALEATALQNDAFYDFFQVDVLAKLEHHEILLCLRHIAQQRDEGGRRVLEILDRDPARIHALYDLTGGNPRTLALLYLVLETSGDDGVMKDLERLLDQATPLYKARVEELAPQARVVFDALALAWDPAPASHLAETTGLEASTVSTQLDRLVRDGVVEKATLSSTRRIAYQVAERFFNIWYLMRHSPRRQRLRLRWLTEMLRRIYTPRELRDRAAGFLVGPKRERSRHAQYCLALSDAVSDRELRTALRGSVRHIEGGFQIEEDLGMAMELAPKSECSPAVVDDEETIEIYRQAITSKPHDAGLWNSYGKLLLKKEEAQVEAESALRKAIELDGSLAEAWTNLGCLLVEVGQDRYAEAEVALRKAIELDPKDAGSWNGLGWLLASRLWRYPEAEDAYRKAIELDPKNAWLWNSLGILLADRLERYPEAEDAFRKATEFDPTFAAPWDNLGNLLGYRLERYPEAEAAYRKAIELDPKYASTWGRLGTLLADRLERYPEAEAAFQKAIEIDPKVAPPWNSLGRLLATRLERYPEAEAAYQKTLELNPELASTWNNLGWLLSNQLERYPEAETAYRSAIELNPNFAEAWNNLGILLEVQLERYPEAELAYRKAIELDPNFTWPWNNLGILLTRQMERYTEAEAVYRKAIELNPDFAAAWSNLGLLLANRLKSYSEAETAFQMATELDPKLAGPWNNLGHLLADQLERYPEAASAFRKAAELEPKEAWRWNQLGILLADRLEHYPEAEAAFRKAIELDPKNAELWSNLGLLLADKLERYPEAEAIYLKAIGLDSKDAELWNYLGCLLADNPVRLTEAEKAYREAFRLDPQEPFATANLAYLLLGQAGRKADAEPLYRAAIEMLPPHGARLLRAFYAVTEDNFGAATEELREVLDEGHEELFTVFRDDLLRILQLAAERGYGEKLLAWFESSGLGARYWPLQVAFDAYLHGEERLMDVNPEVRSGARRLVSEMSRRPRGTPEESPETPPKKARRKKGGR